MAESYTYADLRFVKGSQTPYPAGSGTVYTSDSAELTYENVTCSARGVSGDRGAGASARTGANKLQEGKSWKKPIILVLAVICLVILVTCIVLGVQLFQVSKDGGTQKRNFLQSIDLQTETLEDTENRLRDTQLKLSQAKDQLKYFQAKMNDFNNSWHSSQKELNESEQKLSESQQNATETQRRLSSAEGSLKGVKTLFADYEDAECCPKGWTLLAGSCLYFSEDGKDIYLSKSYCQSKGAWLVGNTIKDPVVQEYMKNKHTEEYWIGLRAKKWGDLDTIDPSRSEKDLTEYRWSIRTVQGQREYRYCRDYCYYHTYHYVCEKEPMKIKLQHGVPALLRKGP